MNKVAVMNQKNKLKGAVCYNEFTLRALWVLALKYYLVVIVISTIFYIVDIMAGNETVGWLTRLFSTIFGLPTVFFILLFLPAYYYDRIRLNKKWLRAVRNPNILELLKYGFEESPCGFKLENKVGVAYVFLHQSEKICVSIRFNNTKVRERAFIEDSSNIVDEIVQISSRMLK